MSKYKKGKIKAAESKIRHKIFPNLMVDMVLRTIDNALTTSPIPKTIEERAMLYCAVIDFFKSMQEQNIINEIDYSHDDEYKVATFAPRAWVAGEEKLYSIVVRLPEGRVQLSEGCSFA